MSAYLQKRPTFGSGGNCCIPGGRCRRGDAPLRARKNPQVEIYWDGRTLTRSERKSSFTLQLFARGPLAMGGTRIRFLEFQFGPVKACSRCRRELALPTGISANQITQTDEAAFPPAEPFASSLLH